MQKISVLIPIYNTQNFLKQCIESVINQTYKNLEIILINDGSKDKSKETIENFLQKDNRIKLIDKKNTGYGNSLNIALKKASGEYISIVESDDFIDSVFYETLIRKAKEENEIVKASFAFYDDFKNEIYDLANLDNPNRFLIQPSIWSCIYKKDFLLKNNINFQETKGASFQDISFFFKTLYFAKKIKVINQPLYFYRINNENSSINSNNKFDEIIKEFREIDKIIENEKDKEILSNKLLFELKAYIWAFRRTKEEKKKEFIKIISQKFKKTNLKPFYKNKKVNFKNKLKMFLLVNCKNLFYYILKSINNK